MIIVKLKPGRDYSESTVGSICRKICTGVPKGQLVNTPDKNGIMVVSVCRRHKITKICEELNQNPDVEFAEPLVVDHVCATPSDPRFPEQWGLSRIGLKEAWKLQKGEENVIIGIIDSGLSMDINGSVTHPDLDEPGRIVRQWDYLRDSDSPRDGYGHGTLVAGIAAADTDSGEGIAGVNWHSPVYVCRVVDDDGDVDANLFYEAVRDMVDYAESVDAKVVINYSVSGPPSQTKFQACKYADDRGMIICAAVGNDGNTSAVEFPAAYSNQLDGVIAVGAMDETNNVSDFSNTGPEVTVVAPGSNILSTSPTYDVTLDLERSYHATEGTSFATPFVTGLVSLIWSRHKGFSNKKIKECITSTAVHPNGGSFDHVWGHGLINAPKALRHGDDTLAALTETSNFRSVPSQLVAISTLVDGQHGKAEHVRETDWRSLTGVDMEIISVVRIGQSNYSPRELDLSRFEQFKLLNRTFKQAGLQYLHELAASQAADLASQLGIEREDAVSMVEEARTELRHLGAALN